MELGTICAKALWWEKPGTSQRLHRGPGAWWMTARPRAAGSLKGPSSTRSPSRALGTPQSEGVQPEVLCTGFYILSVLICRDTLCIRPLSDKVLLLFLPILPFRFRMAAVINVNYSF